MAKTEESKSQQAIYMQLRSLNGDLRKSAKKRISSADPAHKERKNSKRSRAHRHEDFLIPLRSNREKAQAICRLSRMFEDGWLSADNLLLVVSDIMKGD